MPRMNPERTGGQSAGPLRDQDSWYGLRKGAEYLSTAVGSETGLSTGTARPTRQARNQSRGTDSTLPALLSR